MIKCPQCEVAMAESGGDLVCPSCGTSYGTAQLNYQQECM